MGIGLHKIENHIDGFKEEIKMASSSSPRTFFNWFDDCGGDVYDNFLSGKCEFILYILTPLLGLLKKPADKVVLEIGYGGGRLLAAAAEIFKTAVGVDIHENSDLVSQELKRRCVENFQLLQNDGRHIPVGDCEVDLVYSNIVLQHVEKIDIFESYVKESFRVLKHDGYVVLYFGRLFTFSLNTKSSLLYAIDTLLEKICFRGYKEIFTRVNVTNLKITMNYAQSVCEKVGFSVVGHGVSRKIPSLRYGGQNYLVLKKI